ncbi:hypothetical protein JCM5353_002249 [Sporobolomyces roseus]
MIGKKERRDQGRQQIEQGKAPSRSQAVFEADPRVRQPFSQVPTIPGGIQSDPAFSFAATSPLKSPSRSVISPLSPSSSTSSLRYSDSSSSPSSSFHTSPPSPVTWRAERSWDVDPYKLDDEEVDILGALLPVVAVAEETKSSHNLSPSPASTQSQLRKSPSAYSFPTTQHQLKHQQSISNRSHNSSTRTLPNPHPSPSKPRPPLPPPSTSSSASSTSLEYLRHREPLSTPSASSVRIGGGGSEGTRSEVDGLETLLRRIHVTSETLVGGSGNAGTMSSRIEGESKRTEKLRGGERSWSRTANIDVGVRGGDREREGKATGKDAEEVLKFGSDEGEDEDEFSLSLLPPRFPSPPPRHASPIHVTPASPTSSTFPTVTRPYRTSSLFSHSTSSLLLPPSTPPPTSPLPPLPSDSPARHHSRHSSATTEDSTRESISTAPTSPIPPPASKPKVRLPPAPSTHRDD